PTGFPSSPDTSELTLFKDIPLNTNNNTFLRFYRPVSTPTQKLPIIIYFHGGGFVFSSATDAYVHNACSNISAHSPALVISLDYRLAPTHRLPAAYDDGVDAIQWVRDQGLMLKVEGCDEWLNEFGDFSKVYLMGTSAGGNLTYHAGLRALQLDLDPILIVGLIMDQPSLGGVERTKAELRRVNDRVIPLTATDFMWSFALPLSSDRDHEYANPLGNQHKSSNEMIKRLPMCMIRVNGDDPMIDRQKDFANMLEAHGVHVTRKFYEDECHGVETTDHKKAQILYDDVKDFIWN
nr:probable carboxylesterase 8 [Tanacetum cinerariifolium]